MEKIIFFHMNQLGDLLFSLPVLSAARKQWPGKVIYSVAKPEHFEILEKAGLADVLVPKCLACVFKKTRRLIQLRREKIEKGVFFSESPESMLLGFTAGIKERVGFSTASLSFLLTSKAERTGVPSLKNNKALGVKAGLKDIPENYVGLVKVPEEISKEAESWLKENSINPEKLVVIAPGASSRRRSKSWPPANWKVIIERLSEKGWSGVLAGAPTEKEELENILMSAFYGAAVFAPDAGLLKLAALMSKAKLFAGIDSGAMHLAASMGTKVVALFGETDPSQVGPMPLENNIVIKKDNMQEITVEEVWQNLSEALS